MATSISAIFGFKFLTRVIIPDIYGAHQCLPWSFSLLRLSFNFSKHLLQNLAKIEHLSGSQITPTQDNEGDGSNDKNNDHSHFINISDLVLWGEVDYWTSIGPYSCQNGTLFNMSCNKSRSNLANKVSMQMSCHVDTLAKKGSHQSDLCELWERVLKKFHRTSLVLQSPNFDLNEACRFLKPLQDFIQNLRDKFEDVESCAHG